ncbi:SNX41 [Candida oxycetoniae]|uniref:SNX41 n=1 Tax=Candida oxycetoniae TaxID=497107 RepID=A0AAI9SVB4_9ASCO|nr:SNX41 [Candida oxycetoniae]KAI3403723.2 SNX41 [Candida oxycetoniae]
MSDDNNLFDDIEQDNNPSFYGNPSILTDPYHTSSKSHDKQASSTDASNNQSNDNKTRLQLGNNQSNDNKTRLQLGNNNIGHSKTFSNDEGYPHELVNSTIGLSNKITQLLNDKHLQIDIINSEKLINSSIIVYTIQLFSEESLNKIVVKRRYSEFKSLRDNLIKLFPTLIIPPIPEKHSFLSYLLNTINIDNESNIVEMRKRYFKLFLDDIVFDSSEELKNCPLVHKFLDPNYELCWYNALNEPPVNIIPNNLLLANPVNPTDQNGLYSILPIVNGFDISTSKQDHLSNLKKINDELYKLNDQIKLFELKGFEQNLKFTIPDELISFELRFHKVIKNLSHLNKIDMKVTKDYKGLINILVDLGGNLNNFSLQIYQQRKHDLESERAQQQQQQEQQEQEQEQEQEQQPQLQSQSQQQHTHSHLHLQQNDLSETIEKFGSTMDQSFLNFENFVFNQLIPQWQEPVNQLLQYNQTALNLIKFYKYKIIQFKVLYKLKFNKFQQLINLNNIIDGGRGSGSGSGGANGNSSFTSAKTDEEEDAVVINSLDHLKELNSPTLNNALKSISLKKVAKKSSWYGLFGGNNTPKKFNFQLPVGETTGATNPTPSPSSTSSVTQSFSTSPTSSIKFRLAHLEKELNKINQLIELCNNDMIQLTQAIMNTFNDFLKKMEKKWLVIMINYLKNGRTLFDENLTTWKGFKESFQVDTLTSSKEYLFKGLCFLLEMSAMDIDSEISTVLATIRSELESSELISYFYQLEDFYERRLWHQLTQVLDELYYKNPGLITFELKNKVYTLFISQFQTKLNPTKIVDFLLESFKPEETLDKLIQLRVEFVNNLKREHNFKDEADPEFVKLVENENALVYIDLQISRFHLLLNQLDEAELILTKLEKTKFQELNNDLNAKTNAAYYLAKCELYKILQNYNEFYKNGLLYLSSTMTLSQEEKIKLCYELCIAALLSDKVYNFGELRLHDILNEISTPESQYNWLYNLIQNLNSGNIKEYNHWLAIAFEKSPFLTTHKTFLNQKIIIMALLELISIKSASTSMDKTLTFQEISQFTETDLNDVELLIIKCFSLGLIQGYINQIDQVLIVTWLQPRILHLESVKTLYNHLVEWGNKVDQLGKTVYESGGTIWAGLYSKKDWGGSLKPHIEITLNQFGDHKYDFKKSGSEKEQQEQEQEQFDDISVSFIIFEYKDLVNIGAYNEQLKEYILVCDDRAINEYKVCNPDQRGQFVVNSNSTNSTILSSKLTQLGPANIHYPINRTGYYCISTFTTVSDSKYEGIINFQNAFGQLSASEIPKLPAYGILTLCYAITLVLFGFQFFKKRKENQILPLQRYLLAMLGFLTFDTLVIWSYYDCVNRVESPTNGLVRAYMVFMAICNAIKITFSFFLLLCISLGYGVVKLKLSKKTMFWCKILAACNFVSSLIYLIFNYYGGSSSAIVNTSSIDVAEAGGFLGLLPLIPISIVLSIYYVTILSSLRKTTSNLHQQRQIIKLQLYQHLYYIILLAVALTFLGLTLSTFIYLSMSTTDMYEQHWKGSFFIFDFWPSVVYFFVFLIIAWLWRPTETSYMLAVSQQLSTGEEGIDDPDHPNYQQGGLNEFELDDLSLMSHDEEEVEDEDGNAENVLGRNRIERDSLELEDVKSKKSSRNNDQGSSTTTTTAATAATAAAPPDYEEVNHGDVPSGDNGVTLFDIGEGDEDSEAEEDDRLKKNI